MLPTRWSGDGYDQRPFTENGKNIKYDCSSETCISPNKPLPAGLKRFYFEITIKESGEEIWATRFALVRYIRTRNGLTLRW